MPDEPFFLKFNPYHRPTTLDCGATLPDYRLRFVADAGLDDQKLFAELADDEFVIRASHMERIVDVYNERLNRWERETLQDLVDVVWFTHTFHVTFTHAQKTRLATIKVDWFPIRLPTTHQRLWALVAYDVTMGRTLILLTNAPLHSVNEAVVFTMTGVYGHGLNIAIALIRNKASMLKICGYTRWNA